MNPVKWGFHPSYGMFHGLIITYQILADLHVFIFVVRLMTVAGVWQRMMWPNVKARLKRSPPPNVAAWPKAIPKLNWSLTNWQCGHKFLFYCWAPNVRINRLSASSTLAQKCAQLCFWRKACLHGGYEERTCWRVVDNGTQLSVAFEILRAATKKKCARLCKEVFVLWKTTGSVTVLFDFYVRDQRRNQ